MKRRSLLNYVLAAVTSIIFSGAAGTNVLEKNIESLSIEVYTASYCSECQRAKWYMKTNNIEYVEYDVEHDVDRRREFYARGGKGIPLLFVRGNPLHGFDQEEFEKLRAGQF